MIVNKIEYLKLKKQHDVLNMDATYIYGGPFGDSHILEDNNRDNIYSLKDLGISKKSEWFEVIRKINFENSNLYDSYRRIIRESIENLHSSIRVLNDEIIKLAVYLKPEDFDNSTSHAVYGIFPEEINRKCLPKNLNLVKKHIPDIDGLKFVSRLDEEEYEISKNMLVSKFFESIKKRKKDKK